MKATIKIEKEVELKTLRVQANIRYWEDASVDGENDEHGTLIPCRDGNLWCPEIDLETGKILNWKQGVKADVHYKVCDEGVYTLVDNEGNNVYQIDGYVPNCMSPLENDYGDYIIMEIDENGLIKGWEFKYEEFID